MTGRVPTPVNTTATSREESQVSLIVHGCLMPYGNLMALMVATHRLIHRHHAALFVAFLGYPSQMWLPVALLLSTVQYAHRSAPTTPQLTSVIPESTEPPIGAQPSPPITHAQRTLMHDTLTHGSLNVGGVEITPNRLCHLLSGFQPLPHTLALQEFKPCSSSSIRDHERVAMYWGFHLLASSQSSWDGVALLVHNSISPNEPDLQVLVPGKLITTSLPLRSDPSMPRVTIASYYGLHTARERLQCEPHLDRLLDKCAVILGDFNAVTHTTHTTAIRPNMWPWLVAKEKSGRLADLVLPHHSEVPYTHVRRYAGTKSYLDKAYGTRLFTSMFSPSGARVLDFSAVRGIQDHDPVLVHTTTWACPHVPEPRCAMWNRRDVDRYKKKYCLLCLKSVALCRLKTFPTHTLSCVPTCCMP